MHALRACVHLQGDLAHALAGPVCGPRMPLHGPAARQSLAWRHAVWPGVVWCGLVLAQELRRGADAAHIYSLALSRDCGWLACTSAKGTLHVFALTQQQVGQSRSRGRRRCMQAARA